METDEKSQKLTQIYKKSFRNGRGTAAYIIDRAALLIVIGAAIWLAVHQRMHNRTAAIMLEAACMGVVIITTLLVDRLLLFRHIKKLRRYAEKSIIEIKAYSELDCLKSRITDDLVYFDNSIEALTAEAVKAAHDAGAKMILSMAPKTEKAEALLSYYGIELDDPISFLGSKPEALLKATDDEIDEHLIKTFGKASRKPIKELIKNIGLLSQARGRKYLCVGLLLILLSTFMRYSLYYRLLGSFSLTLGTWAYLAESLRHRSTQKNEPL